MVAAWPARTTLHGTLFLLMEPTKLSLKVPSSLGPRTTWSPSRTTPLETQCACTNSDNNQGTTESVKDYFEDGEGEGGIVRDKKRGKTNKQNKRLTPEGHTCKYTSVGILQYQGVVERHQEILAVKPHY